MQVVGQPFQAGRLPLVQGLVALGVVAHEHLAEGRVHRFDVLGEVLAVLEIELVLPALLGGTGRGVAVFRGVAEDGGAELLVHQDAGLFLWHACGERRLEAVIDDPLGAGDFGCLRVAQRGLPAEQLGLEGAAMIERQNVQGAVISSRHQAAPLSLR